jgi:hypothetical protein
VAGGLIGETEARGKVIFVRRKYTTDSVPLNFDFTRAGVEYCEVFRAVMERTKVVPAQAPVEVKSARDLPCILAEEVDAIDYDFSFSVAYCNAAGLNIASQEIGKSKDVGIDRA